MKPPPRRQTLPLFVSRTLDESCTREAQRPFPGSLGQGAGGWGLQSATSATQEDLPMTH